MPPSYSASRSSKPEHRPQIGTASPEGLVNIGIAHAVYSPHRRPIVHGIAPAVASAPIYPPRALIVKSPQSLPFEREGMKLISKISG